MSRGKIAAREAQDRRRQATYEARRMTCPECGAPMDVDHCCVIEEPVYHYDGRTRDMGVPRQRLGAAALCTRCECCLELTRTQLEGLRAITSHVTAERSH